MDGSKCLRDSEKIQSTDSIQFSRNQPTFVDNMSGEVRIQLEGSHTTTSETESDHSKNETSTQLPDPRIDVCGIETCTSSQTINYGRSTENMFPLTKSSADHINVHGQKTNLDLIKIEKDNEAIGERFKQIMEMFDAFTKNLETLELQAVPTMTRPEQEFEMAPKSTFARYDETVLDLHSVSTATSGLELQYQNVPCQTSLHENFSIGPTSIIRTDSDTSRSELQQSLNNYARADNALKITSPAEGHPIKMTHSTQPDPNTTTVVVQEPCAQTFNTIHIEAMSSTSSTALHRPPLCQRLWDVVTDFCAAICLCLQVNRDCIFCLGFFAAFVVSASFLTAFFYRTLSVSPPLWQTSHHHRFIYGGPGSNGGINPRG